METRFVIFDIIYDIMNLLFLSSDKMEFYYI